MTAFVDLEIDADVYERLEIHVDAVNTAGVAMTSITATVAVALGDELDWKKLLPRLDRVRPRAAPTVAEPPLRSLVRCACCPGGCESVLRWRGSSRCACPPAKAGPGRTI